MGRWASRSSAASARPCTGPRSRTSLPAGVPAAAADAARDTLGGALAIAQTLPDAVGAALVEVARIAFLDALHFVAAVAAVGAILTAIAAAIALRSVDARSEPAEVEGGSPETVAAME